MPRIYWYKTRDGRVLQESDDSAWRLHNVYVNQKHYDYIGWSDGRFVTKHHLKKNKDGLTTDFTQKKKQELRSMEEQELNFARENPDRTPPPDRSRKQMGRQPINKGFTANART